MATATIAKETRADKVANLKAKADRARKVRDAADLMKQVSDPTRLQILLLLTDKQYNVTELCEALGTQSQPAVSHHLQLLKMGGLIEASRQGKNNYYGLTDGGRSLIDAVRPLI